MGNNGDLMLAGALPESSSWVLSTIAVAATAVLAIALGANVWVAALRRRR